MNVESNCHTKFCTAWLKHRSEGTSLEKEEKYVFELRKALNIYNLTTRDPWIQLSLSVRPAWPLSHKPIQANCESQTRAQAAINLLDIQTLSCLSLSFSVQFNKVFITHPTQISMQVCYHLVILTKLSMSKQTFFSLACFFFTCALVNYSVQMRKPFCTDTLFENQTH